MTGRFAAVMSGESGPDDAGPSLVRWMPKGVRRSPGGTRLVASVLRARPGRSRPFPGTQGDLEVPQFYFRH